MDHEEQDAHFKTVIASLESKVDLLESELTYINKLLMHFGFSEGTESLKLAIEELLGDQIDELGDSEE